MFDNHLQKIPVGRFAPSPSGRMHLGNIFTAYMSWKSVKERGGRWILRIEDLDPQRSRIEYARQIEDDLCWLGLDWDEGGLDDFGPNAPYSQSKRGDIYRFYFDKLIEKGVIYSCRCRRADIMATQAPHQSDGRIIYSGTCRPSDTPPFRNTVVDDLSARIYVPDRIIEFEDALCGIRRVSLVQECGDFVVRRADGAWAYQLAVVVDDALMGVNEVVRGRDLLLSAAQQIYLYELLGWDAPVYAHVPLICNENGVRLSKRDASAGMDALRKKYTPSGLRNMLEEMSQTML